MGSWQQGSQPSRSTSNSQMVCKLDRTCRKRGPHVLEDVRNFDRDSPIVRHIHSHSFSDLMPTHSFKYYMMSKAKSAELHSGILSPVFLSHCDLSREGYVHKFCTIKMRLSTNTLKIRSNISTPPHLILAILVFQFGLPSGFDANYKPNQIKTKLKRPNLTFLNLEIPKFEIVAKGCGRESPHHWSGLPLHSAPCSVLPDPDTECLFRSASRGCEQAWIHSLSLEHSTPSYSLPSSFPHFYQKLFPDLPPLTPGSSPRPSILQPMAPRSPSKKTHIGGTDCWGLGFHKLSLLLSAAGKEVCYERVGCFKDGYPWTHTWSRPLAGLPWPPEKIGTRFLLYTQQNPDTYQEISAVNDSTISHSNFDPDHITRINIAGWKTDGRWQRDMCNALLRVEDVNCINLDWINGSKVYIHSVNNLRVAGAEVAYFVHVLEEKFGYSPSQVHLIGHSVGAHLAGEAGSRIPGLGRITGMDPAGPYFHDSPNEVRLDPSDANLVDVIHTNAARFLFALGSGTINACGHLDFYPNGGKSMPGCEELVIPPIYNFTAYKEEVSSFISCNHVRSYHYYIESILNPDAFIAYPCRSYTSFKTGNCFHCPKEGCPMMGHFADKFHLKNKKSNRLYYFLNTGKVSPFARWMHNLSVNLAGNNITQGNIYLLIGGTAGKTGKLLIASGDLRPGTTYTKFISVDVYVGNVTSIEFTWKPTFVGLSQNKLGAEKVINTSGKYGYISTFCSQDVIGSQVTQILKPC
ncbi:pancreatic lipase-related protein 3 [Suncus etruscus]|uniref:pancreatic lipase-related protein 3 n=1 Tax=Suncus etruscus TaxID=109475 RepID=UPI0021102576|nr:pancreatic lipase-related protein 3 [Suncus etruscus]